MGKYNRNRIDSNQSYIVAALRKMGFTVSVDHDDLIIGHQGVNYWVELKDPDKTLCNDGRVKANVFKKAQIDLMRDWKGQYLVAWELSEIIEIITKEQWL